MKRKFHHYRKWEDWRDGLYGKSVSKDSATVRAARLLADERMLLIAMRQVVSDWVHSAEVNLSNRNRNRRAWLGQAACCYVCGTPERLVKDAWHMLSAAEQVMANSVADKVIREWERCRSED